MRIRLADKSIEIKNMYSYVEEYCRDYLIPEGTDADFSFCIHPEDIASERHRSEQEDMAKGYAIRKFSDEYLETLAVYRKIAERMPLYDTVLFHGSCVAVDGEGYLFTAKSGTGKSTHVKLWCELLGTRARIVNDDKPLIQINGAGRAAVYGTPWDGKHRMSSNISVPLRAICFLKQASENSMRRITKQEAYPMLLQQVYRTVDPVSLKKTLFLLDRLEVKFYQLFCNTDISAAKLSYQTLTDNGG